MSKAVIDTSVLAAFSGIGRLDLLLAIFPEIHIAPAVYREIVTDGTGWVEVREAQEWICEGRFRVIRAEEIPTVAEIANLGLGEREVISWAVHRRMPALIDEALARRAAERLGVSEVVGSLGLLARAKAGGHVREVASLVAQMRSNGIRFGSSLVEKFLVAMNES